MCGAIRPTKPIGPQTATTAPTISDTAKNSRSLVRWTCTPRLKANSSPVVSRFRSSVRYQTIRQPAAMKGKTVQTSWNVTMPSRPPITQRNMRNERVKSLVYCRKRIRLEKKKLTATPASSIVAVEAPWRLPAVMA